MRCSTTIRWYETDVRRRVLNEYINHPVVRLVNPTTKSLEPPRPLEDVLSSIDKTKDNLELVAVKPEAIVRIISKKDTRRRHEQDKAEARARRKSQGSKKQIQMSWAVESRDLMRKLDKGQKEIARGNMVNVILAKKKDVPLPSRGERMRKMDEIGAMMADVADEWSPRTIGKQLAVMFFKPKGKEAPSAAEASALRAEVQEVVDVEATSLSSAEDGDEDDTSGNGS